MGFFRKVLIRICVGGLLMLWTSPGCAVQTKTSSPDNRPKAQSQQSAGRDAKSTTLQYVSNGLSGWTIFLTQIPATILGYWLGKGGWQQIEKRIRRGDDPLRSSNE